MITHNREEGNTLNYGHYWLYSNVFVPPLPYAAPRVTHISAYASHSTWVMNPFNPQLNTVHCIHTKWIARPLS